MEAAVPFQPQTRSAPGTVLALLPEGGEQPCEHERAALLGFAGQLAALRGEAAGGFHRGGAVYAGHAYFVPHATLSTEEAGALGIAGPDDLFGGVVPRAFVATKAITHPLVDPAARAVAGWNARFADAVARCVLQGYTVFDPDAAWAAGRRLLAQGPLRLKPVRASGSRGQAVVRDLPALQVALQAMDPREIVTHGLVLEEDLAELRTFSIGQVHVAGLTASYFGLQRSTCNNAGQRVYGGSQLTVARGGYDALLALRPPQDIADAVAQAHCYDAAVRACYPGFHASRSNYDVLLGRDAAGRVRSGVLEQSWRVGGATGAELGALQRLQVEPRRQVVRAMSLEVFGESAPPPAGATVHYRGVDPALGPLTRYTLVEPA
jgi:hypothetical protein